MSTKTENGIVTDDRGNRATVDWWGTEEAAIAALKSLEDCSGCSGCSHCSGCSGCSPQKITATIPVIEQIHQKIFDAVSQPGELCMSTWHTCETTHCRAGWVVTLAGAEGKSLEKETSTLFAAQQIYRASGYDISPVRFFDSDEAAMADMKRLAESNT